MFVAFIMLGAFGFQAQAQAGSEGMYLVYFKDKAGTTFTTDNPQAYLSQRAIDRRQKQNIAIDQTDLPVSGNYIQKLKESGADVWYTTKWLNGAIVVATANQMSAIRSLAFVTEDEYLRPGITPKDNDQINEWKVDESLLHIPPAYIRDTSVYGSSWSQVSQLNAHIMHREGYMGKGIWIGVFDSGFENVHKHAAMQHLQKEGRILGTYDFIERETSVYEDHNHGAAVLSTMAAYLPGKLVGTAPGSFLPAF